MDNFLPEKFVKYNNRLNDTAFTDFSALELDLFFTLLTELRYSFGKDVKITYEAVRDAIDYDKTKSARVFHQTLKDFYSKLKGLTFVHQDGEKYSEYVIFPTFHSDYKEKTVSFGINKDLSYLIVDFERYTEFALYNHNNLRSTYAKTALRLLSQFKRTGKRIFTFEEFCRLFDVPDTYKAGNIKQSVIKPILLELSPIFRNLRITPLKRDQKDKRKISHYLVEFAPMVFGYELDVIEGRPKHPGKNASRQEIFEYIDKKRRYEAGERFDIPDSHPYKQGEKVGEMYKQAEGQISAEDFIKNKGGKKQE